MSRREVQQEKRAKLLRWFYACLPTYKKPSNCPYHEQFRNCQLHGKRSCFWLMIELCSWLLNYFVYFFVWLPLRSLQNNLIRGSRPFSLYCYSTSVFIQTSLIVKCSDWNVLHFYIFSTTFSLWTIFQKHEWSYIL